MDSQTTEVDLKVVGPISNTSGSAFDMLRPRCEPLLQASSADEDQHKYNLALLQKLTAQLRPHGPCTCCAILLLEGFYTCASLQSLCNADTDAASLLMGVNRHRVCESYSSGPSSA